MSRPDSSYPREANGLAMKGPMLPTRVEAAANACEVEDNKRVVVHLREIDILLSYGILWQHIMFHLRD